MCERRLLLGVVYGLVFCGLALGRQPGKPTPERLEKIQQHNRLLAEAQELEKKGETGKAIAAVEKALTLERELIGKDHMIIATSLRALGQLHETGEDFAAAGKERKEAVAMLTRILGKEHWEVTDVQLEITGGEALARLTADQRKQLRAAKTLIQGMSLGSQDQPQQALQVLMKAVAVQKKLLGENHPDYATGLNNLASVYKSLGDYRAALPLQEQVRELRKKLLGENHPDYANSLNNLAHLYELMGDYPKALLLSMQTCELNKKLLGENHPSYATSLNNLAHVYESMAEYSKALPLYEQARDLRKKILGENHPSYATSLNNLASAYQSSGDSLKALTLYEEALKLRKKVLGQNHPDYATSLNNLASLYCSMGHYAKAFPLCEQAHELLKKQRGENHPDYAVSLNNLAVLSYMKGDYETSQRLSRLALDRTLQRVQESFDVVGERQRLEAFQTLQRFLGSFILIAKQTELPASKAYTVLLKCKGTVAFRQSADLLLRDQPAIQPLLQQLRSIQTQLAKAAFEAPSTSQLDAWATRLKQLRDNKEKLEEQLAQASTIFRNLRRPPPTLEQLRQSLPRRTALIDLVVFRNERTPEKDKARKNEEKLHHLAAFVVRPSQDVQMVFMDDLKSLETLVEGWRHAVSGNNHAAQVEAARQIHQLLWQPLQKHLDGVDTVLISPDGPLLRFPFAALPGKQPDTYLLEDLAIGYVTSGRQVVDLLQPPDKDLTPPAGLLTLGGVDYGSNEERKQAFEPLPGTDLEAVRVRQQFRKRFPDQRATALLGEMPTRGKVVAEINKHYRYLHLATHGFFESPERIAAMRASQRNAESGLSLEQRSQRDDILAFLPLLRSGLVLAGANKTGGDESLLTAEDLSALDLRGTDLVVLSACETSLGKLTQGDGVLGLQRGFHAGGARTLVTSLWSVDDAATSVLMEEFYQNLWRKEKPLSKLEALRQAQLFVLKNPKRVQERSRELQGQLAKRGLPANSLRGPKGDAVCVIDDGKPAPGERSPASSWAGFVMSGEMAEAKK